MRPIDTIVVHCTATPEGRDVSAAEIDKWHKARGWSGIGYHKVVRLDGTIENGRDPDNDGDVEEHIGAHVSGHNARSLAVVYAGGLDKDGNPKDTRTPAQKDALLSVVEDWMLEFDLAPENVKGHYEFANKACPCFDMDQFRAELSAGTATQEGLTIRQVQSALNKALRLDEDGIMGQLTHGALVRFQQIRGLPAIGYLTPDTEAALRGYL